MYAKQRCTTVLINISQIDYTNAASVKVLQVGKPSNILTQLGMTADQYNWVQSIYFVSGQRHLHPCNAS